MSKNLPNSSGLMRTTLRDALKLLKKIRVFAGMNDEQVEVVEASVGDAFRDKNNEFIKCVKRTKEQISERNTGMKKNGNDVTAIEQSNNIRKEIRHLCDLAAEIKVMVGDAERSLIKENKKTKVNEKKRGLLERQYQERHLHHRQCLETIELVKNMDMERLDPNGKLPSQSLGQQTGKKLTLHERFDMNVIKMRAEREAKRRAAAAVGATSDEVEMGDRCEGRFDDSAFKVQLNTIAQQDVEVNQSLIRLSNNVKMLYGVAEAIGSELDNQNALLDHTENTVETQARKLKGINRRLSKIMKNHSPINTCVTVLCIIFILALVGFFLVQLDVI
ncbi:transmembrane protein, putative [Bodo saltans]|uniref:Transmembrane protein, putative n=1 Tax=Bodo saltans TaxID=75058 RepID=A0A0S4IVZ4_BODSA|nr:transmembrane protein, putative [Bodo saltans]|eukprot:CUG05758.1 transmembrane protein, putative [Bodo saltans]